MPRNRGLHNICVDNVLIARLESRLPLCIIADSNMCGKKLILSCTEPRFDYVDLFIIDFARKPISESDFYYYNMFDIARLD